jgi:hypothetical protein
MATHIAPKRDFRKLRVSKIDTTKAPATHAGLLSSSRDSPRAPFVNHFIFQSAPMPTQMSNVNILSVPKFMGPEAVSSGLTRLIDFTM